MLIAAQAKAGNLVLVTNNTKELEKIEGLAFENRVKA
jgi:predicted nucleic acid-binding protein